MNRLPAIETAPFGVLLLRLSLGTMFLAHSLVLKLMTYGLPGTAKFFVAVGLPAALAYLTFTAEVVGGILLILGAWTRTVALALAPIMIGALLFVHAPNGWVFTSPNGGWEYPLYLFVLCIAQALLGSGPLAFDAARHAAGSEIGAKIPQPAISTKNFVDTRSQARYIRNLT